MNFFLPGVVRNYLFEEEVAKQKKTKSRIRTVFLNVTREMLENIKD